MPKISRVAKAIRELDRKILAAESKLQGEVDMLKGARAILSALLREAGERSDKPKRSYRRRVAAVPSAVGEQTGSR